MVAVVAAGFMEDPSRRPTITTTEWETYVENLYDPSLDEVCSDEVEICGILGPDGQENRERQEAIAKRRQWCARTDRPQSACTTSRSFLLRRASLSCSLSLASRRMAVVAQRNEGSADLDREAVKLGAAAERPDEAGLLPRPRPTRVSRDGLHARAPSDPDSQPDMSAHPADPAIHRVPIVDVSDPVAMTTRPPPPMPRLGEATGQQQQPRQAGEAVVEDTSFAASEAPTGAPPPSHQFGEGAAVPTGGVSIAEPPPLAAEPPILAVAVPTEPAIPPTLPPRPQPQHGQPLAAFPLVGVEALHAQASPSQSTEVSPNSQAQQALQAQVATALPYQQQVSQPTPGGISSAAAHHPAGLPTPTNSAPLLRPPERSPQAATRTVVSEVSEVWAAEEEVVVESKPGRPPYREACSLPPAVSAFRSSAATYQSAGLRVAL